MYSYNSDHSRWHKARIISASGMHKHSKIQSLQWTMQMLLCQRNVIANKQNNVYVYIRQQSLS